MTSWDLGSASVSCQAALGSTKRRAGHALVEVIVVVALTSIVVGSIYSALFAQHRFYLLQSEMAGTRDALRIAAEVLAGELRAINPSAGDLYGIGPDSVALRAAVGFGAVCGLSGNSLVLWHTSGIFGTAPTDSLLVFLEGNVASSDDDDWGSARIRTVRRASSQDCGESYQAELRVSLDQELTGVTIGSPVRAFRPYVYRLYRSGDGRWWLGQRLRHGRIQPLAGPFASPSSGGLKLEYLTAEGVSTLDPRGVVSVSISVKAESHSPVPRRGGVDVLRDSLSTVVFVRNS